MNITRRAGKTSSPPRSLARWSSGGKLNPDKHTVTDACVYLPREFSGRERAWLQGKARIREACALCFEKQTRR